MWCRGLILVLLVVFAPQAAQAAVSINEVAWMGTAVSANDEWIELYNDSSESISVDGWLLEDGQALSIPLWGTLTPGQYAVLERTDDDTAPGSAFLIYTGALANTGATLVLKDAGGATVDQVAGGENWETIGGDNTTKETAQYNASGWITAAPTPGRANATIGTPKDDTDTAASKPRGSSSGSVIVRPRTAMAPRTLIPSTNTLALKIKMPEVIYVNQPVKFEAEPAAVGETIMNSLHYTWNFGDMSVATGSATTHSYAYPGEYIVTVRARYGRHDEYIQQPVTVLPVRFSLTQNASGDIQIHNDSPYEVDLSGFSVMGERSVKFPPLSFAAAGGTVTVPKAKISAPKFGVVQLLDQKGIRVAALGQGAVGAARETSGTEVAPLLVPEVMTQAVVPPFFSFAEASAMEKVATSSIGEATSTATAPTPGLQAAVTHASGHPPRDYWTLVGLLGVIALGVAGIFFGSQKTEASTPRGDAPHV